MRIALCLLNIMCATCHNDDGASGASTLTDVMSKVCKLQFARYNYTVEQVK